MSFEAAVVEKCGEPDRMHNFFDISGGERGNIRRFALSTYSRKGNLSDNGTFASSKFKLFTMFQIISWVHVVPSCNHSR